MYGGYRLHNMLTNLQSLTEGADKLVKRGSSWILFASRLLTAALTKLLVMLTPGNADTGVKEVTCGTAGTLARESYAIVAVT